MHSIKRRSQIINKSATIFILVIGLLILSSSLLRLHAAPIEIIIPGNVEITSPQIRLGEIAEFNIASGEETIVNALSVIELGQAPRPGHSKNISRELVSLYVRNSGFSRDQFTIKAPDKIKIEISTIKISEADLATVIGKKLEKEIFEEISLEIKDNDSQILVEFLSGPGELTMPAGEVKYSFVNDLEAPAGRLNLPVEVIIDGEVWKRIFFSYNINYRLPVLTLINKGERGKKIETTDLRWEERLIEFFPSNLIIDQEQKLVRNGVFKRNYEKGSILRHDMLELPVIIRYNQIIRAEVKIGTIHVSARVKAKNSGKIGDVIEVENINSGKIMKAKILNENLVQVMP